MKKSEAMSVKIVIPVYKPQLTQYELISLKQCLRILGNYSICLVAPHSLNISVYRELISDLQVHTFDDHYFVGIQGYNKLMLSKVFYQSFLNFEYMLIYQLDAFVFRDDLVYWCQQGYDYIGAPLLRDRDFVSRFDQLNFSIRKQLATWLSLKKSDGITPREIISLNQVGNGGFSLRRIAAMVRCLDRFHKQIVEYERHSLYQYNEDMFWSIEVNRYWPHLYIPSYRTASYFSIEFYPEWAVEHYNHGKLPFGCHAWDIHGTDYWRSVFAHYGYKI